MKTRHKLWLFPFLVPASLGSLFAESSGANRNWPVGSSRSKALSARLPYPNTDTVGAGP